MNESQYRTVCVWISFFLSYRPDVKQTHLYKLLASSDFDDVTVQIQGKELRMQDSRKSQEIYGFHTNSSNPELLASNVIRAWTMR